MRDVDQVFLTELHRGSYVRAMCDDFSYIDTLAKSKIETSGNGKFIVPSGSEKNKN